MQSTRKHEGRVEPAGSSRICGFSKVRVLLILTSILAAIVLVLAPNFFEASYRSPVAKAISELRDLAVSLETYYIDHNAYPPAADDNGNIVPYTEDGSHVSAGYVPFLLSTPISYTGSLPLDPFNRGRDRTRKPYRYATDGLTCWIMSSYGPDRDRDIAMAEFPSKKGAAGDITKLLSHYGIGNAVVFDPSNGTESSGDIIRYESREAWNTPKDTEHSK